LLLDWRLPSVLNDWLNITEYSIRELKGLRLLIKWQELDMYMHYQDMDWPTASLRAAKWAVRNWKNRDHHTGNSYLDRITKKKSLGKCQPQELGNYEVNLLG
jgi:hypothetical protein